MDADDLTLIFVDIEEAEHDYVQVYTNYLKDSVSLTCGNGDGLSFCGERKPLLYMKPDPEEDEYVWVDYDDPVSWVQFDETRNRFEFKTDNRDLIGEKFYYTLSATLKDYPPDSFDNFP